MTSPTRRRLVAAFLAGLALMVIAGLISLIQVESYLNRTRWLLHGQDVLASLSDTRAAIDQGETGARGFLLSGNPARLAAYETARSAIEAQLRHLGPLVAGEAYQQARLQALQGVARTELARLDRLTGMRTTGGLKAAAAMFDGSGHGDHLDEMRRLVTSMIDAERALMSRREVRLAAGSQRVLGAVVRLIVLGAVLLGVAFYRLGRQASALEKSDGALRTSENRLRVIIDNMLAGLITTNDHGIIESSNPAAERMFGAARGELVGRHVTVLHTRPEGDASEFLESVRRRGLGTITEWTGQRRDGTTFPVELSLFEFEAGGQRHFAGIMSDVSERRRIERMKDEFVSTVSHELRTPLTSIRGSLQLVIDEGAAALDEEQRQLLDVALSNCERLIRIINDILDISKIEAGGIQLQRAPWAPYALVEAAIQSVAGMARTNRVRIIPYVHRTMLPISVDGDRIVQVLVNLLSNAVKFAPADSVVTVEVSSRGRMLSFAVHDRGRGIDAADLPRLFQKFQQLDSSSTRQVGGTGLGLAISRALVEQHGGTIDAVSEPGFGTTFTIDLPAGDGVPAPAAVEAPAPAPAPGGSRRRILVVDDDDDMRLVLRRQLEGAGYEVIEARDGNDAVEQTRLHRPDLVLIDLIMPRSSGHAAIRAIAADETIAGTPVVVLSVIADELRPMLGTRPVLQKPVTAETLLREVGRVVGPGQRPRVLIAEDDVLLRGFYTTMIRRRGFRVTAVEDGRRAVAEFREGGADVVLVDLHLPGLHGTDVIQQIRTLPGGATVPIIAMSGMPPEDAARESHQAGANLFMAKPVDLTRCVEQICDLLERRTSEPARRAS
ncbi:MAG TPA: response regulator [Vicinamibacterales bacterium]|nr:response regulator [Vicinamibacterales bacterium]